MATKTKATHTPGRWAAEPMNDDPQAIFIGSPDVGYIAEIRRLEEEDFLDARDWANARLIAAAPELLAACEAMMRDAASFEAVGMPLPHALFAAIAKARG